MDVISGVSRVQQTGTAEALDCKGVACSISEIRFNNPNRGQHKACDQANHQVLLGRPSLHRYPHKISPVPRSSGVIPPREHHTADPRADRLLQGGGSSAEVYQIMPGNRYMVGADAVRESRCDSAGGSTRCSGSMLEQIGTALARGIAGGNNNSPARQPNAFGT